MRAQPRSVVRQRARCAAAFVASAVIGASLAAHATQQCRNRTEMTLEVVSVKIDDKPQPVPPKGKGFAIMSEEASTYGYFYDPDAPEQLRRVQLEDR